MKRYAVVFVGPPGAGKGTQAKKLSAETGWLHIAPGDLFRKHLQQNTPLGKQIREYVEQGRLVPDSIVRTVIAEVLKQHPDTPGFIFDGYPRTLPQASDLEQLLQEENTKLLAVIFFHVPEEELKARIQKRAQEEGRTDDQHEAIILQRFREYMEKTLPLKTHYQKKGIWYTIDGTGSIEEVFLQLWTLINSLLLQTEKQS